MNLPSRPPLPLPEAVPLPVPADWSERLGALGLTLDEETVTRLARYLGLLLAANAHMNLTAITDPVEVWSRHALDALTLLPHVPLRARVVDVGSGGGVPAIPLALARPDARFTLVEATRKKATFLSQVADALGLANVTVRAERAEALARGPLRGAFDVVTARAVAKLAELIPLTEGFLQRDGVFLFIKGQRADEELSEASPVLARHRVVHVETVPTPTGRVLVLRAAGRSTARPRRAKAPRKP
jgi:16S rRNA (guanine527-N7)-methyltransferase